MDPFPDRCRFLRRSDGGAGHDITGLSLSGADSGSGTSRAGLAFRLKKTLGDTDVQFLDRLLLHYGIYRRYPLRPWPAFKNAWRISFR